MLLPILLSVLTSLLAYLLLRWLRLRRYWARRGVPYVQPNPLTGSMTFLFKENCGIWMREIYQRFNTPYIGVWMLWQPALVINSPEIAKRVLVKDSDVFRNRFLSSGKSDPIGGLNIFTVNDPIWTKVRRILNPSFSAAKLRSLHGLFSTKSKELCARIENDLNNKKFIELRSLLSDYASDLIGTSTFGIISDATLTGDSAIRAITREYMKYNIFRGISWTSIFFWPQLVDLFGFTMFPKITVEFTRKLFKTAIAKRDKNTKYNTILENMLLMSQDNNQEGFISEDLLVAQASILLQGGFDTTASALTFTINELAHNPEIQERLYNALMEAKEKTYNGEFDMNSLADITYLDCVLKEAVRKYPPMGWLDRIAATDYVIDDKLTIKKGTPIYVNANGMHYDPQYFPDPEVFNPDRFLPENKHNILPFTYLPFGEGPRICIGLRFAQLTFKYGLAAVLLRFRVRPLPGFAAPSEQKYERNSMFLMPGEPMSVQFEPRN